MLIESLQNEKIKNLTRLITDNRFRKKSGTFVVEGEQENAMAANFGFDVQEYLSVKAFTAKISRKGKLIWYLKKFTRRLLTAEVPKELSEFIKRSIQG